MKHSELLTKRFDKNIAGVLNCFDRIGQKNTCSSSAIKRTSYFAHYVYRINPSQT